ncbi:hypothetical protein E4U41_005825 [Claviceps citrina]|nr:hypothetical protein E4U41_005825 [Claviceps citrina]
MQRVSAFLPSWDKRSSNSSAPKHHSHGGGIFNWAVRNSISSGHGNNNVMAGSSRSSHPVAKSLARINVAAANGDRVHREAFWPSTLDMESLKAARILKSFCFDGFLAPLEKEPAEVPGRSGDPTSTSTPTPTPTSSPEPQNTTVEVMKKIPKRIIQNAAGIAVFTCMRSGLWMTGSGGSGILIARKSDGTWSPPSGIMLHTPTLSFIIGVDVYDCVLVVTNLAALEAITRPRVTLGEHVSLNNGPSTTLDSDNVKLNWQDLDNTVLAYMKARGHHQPVNLHGCILTERANENERFYGGEVTQMDILAGNVARHVEETKPLFEVIKLAEGRIDYDKAIIQQAAMGPAPSDAIIASPKSNAPSPRPAFGVIKADDPDPFGILALEMAGLEIREAGSRLRPTSSQFDIISNPRSSSLFKFDRQSLDTCVSKSNRASVRSLNTIKSQMTDAGTQTDAGKGDTSETTPSPGWSEDGREGRSIDHTSELREAAADIDDTSVDLTSLEPISPRHTIISPHSEQPAIPPGCRPVSSSSLVAQVDRVDPTVKTGATDEDDELEYDTNDADDEDDLDASDEEPAIFEVAQVQPARTRAVASRMIQAKGSVVTIPKRIPPPLPTRSPARNSRCAKTEGGSETSMALSPLRLAFSEADLQSEEEDQLQTSIAARSLSIIETSKSMEPGPGPDQDADSQNSSREEAAHQPRRADEIVQAMPSIDATLLPGDEGSQANGSLQIVACEQTAEIDDELASVMNSNSPAPDDVHTKHMDEDESEYGSVEDQETDNEGVSKTPRAPMDISDSTITSTKHTSSIYTRLTEDGWSIDRSSSSTTPTSERRTSVAEYTTEEDTPRKTSLEEELGAEHQDILIKAVPKPIQTALQIPIRST